MTQHEQTAFSSSAEDAITRTISLAQRSVHAPNPTNAQELARLEDLYEVEWTAGEILRGGSKQVALQFPDELLYISVPIYQGLKRRLGSEIGVYVLADTSYGSCCVDEVAAQHIEADLIVHYGYSCLSSPSRLPVLYVFSQAEIDVQHASQSLLSLWREDSLTESLESPPQNFILIPDVAYAHTAEKLYSSLLTSPLLPPDSQIFYDPVPKRADPTSSSFLPSPPLNSSTNLDPGSRAADRASQTNPPSVPRSHRRYTLPPSVLLSSCTILYVGPENLGLTNLLMTHPENKIISYDPTFLPPQAKIESARTNKLLMRRYAVVQRARDADVIGILVGTLGVASYLPLLSHIRTLLREHRKKSYTLSVGKLSPSKLANFPEIECFVLVACPENTVVDAKEFLRPIVTPFELSLALSAEPSWPGNYILDFEHVIEYRNNNRHPGQANDHDGADGEEPDPDQPVFSLVTGKYRHAKRYGDEAPPVSSTDPSAVILRNTNGALTTLSSTAGAEFLRQRTFQGLEQHLGEDAPSVLEQGRSGIARGYKEDHQFDGGQANSEG